MSSFVFFLAVLGLASADYTSKDKVVVLTEDNFDSEVMSSDDLWFVEFYAPWCGHCKSLEPEWKKAAKQVAGESRIKFAAVDADHHKSLGGRFGVRGFPTIKIFGFNKKSPKEYQSGRSAADLVASAKQELAKLEAESRGEAPPKPPSEYGDDVLMLTADDFDATIQGASKPILVKFMAPWCGHCKNMVPAFAAAGSALKGDAILAAVDAVAEQALAQRFEVRGFPTLKLFMPGEDEPVDYQGGREESQIVEFMTAKAEEAGTSTSGLFQITSADQFEEQCVQKSICVIAALPHIIDGGAERRNRYLEILTDVSKKHRSGFGFAWYAAGEQNGLDEALGFSMQPAVSAVSFKKGRHSRFVQAFDLKRLSNWLARPGATTALAGEPKIKTREPWDGNDYVAPPEEE